MLAAAGVLEFVDEEMMDAVGNGHCGVGRRIVGITENGLRDLGDLSEIERGVFGEDHFELGCGIAK